MNVFILCIFALVPFHNASVHEAKLTVCPDYAEALRFANQLESYQFPYQPNSETESVLPPSSTEETDSTQNLVEETDSMQNLAQENGSMQNLAQDTDSMQNRESETNSEPIPLGQLEPEIAAENSVKPKQPVARSAPSTEPAPLEIPDSLTPKLVSPSKNVVFAAAEEPVSKAQQTPAGTQPQESMPTDAPISRPWGVLMFFIFLLMLSISANVFLGWQLIETRRAKLR